MSAFKRLLAEALGVICMRLLADSRSAWGAAMSREICAIEKPEAALRFAFGCVWACCKERTRSMPAILKLLRLSLIGVMALLAAAVSLSAMRTFDVAPAVAFTFCALAASFIMAAIWYALRGPAAIIQAASTMLAFHLVAQVALRQAPFDPNLALYRGLADEGLVIWSLLLVVGIVLARAPGSPMLRAFARARGWRVDEAQ